MLSDVRWDLRPAIFENHLNAVSINFAPDPERFREVAKIYIWQELNCDEGLPILRRASINGRLAVYTMNNQLRCLRSLPDWLDVHGFVAVADVTPRTWRTTSTRCGTRR